ncbi:DUF502 domain-containing protein [bacterium]|nr:DUF502 domain-containing protein [bacterium]
MLKKIGSIMAAGLFAILPLVITLAVLTYLFNMIYGWLGPESAFGRFVGRHAEKQFEAVLLYVATLVVILLLIFLVGLFTRGQAGTRYDNIRSAIGKYIASHVTGMIKKIPFINTVYNSAEQVVDLFKQRDEDAVQSMSNVVIARISQNTQILGVLASKKPVMVGDVPHYFVYWPSTPVPASGFSYMVPCEDVVDIDISVEEMTRVYVSFGSLGPIIMNSKKQLFLDGREASGKTGGLMDEAQALPDTSEDEAGN